MAPIPVLYVNHAPFLSGAEESLLGVLAALDRTAIEPHLASPPGPLTQRAAEAGIHVVPFPMPSFHRTTNPVTLSSYAVNWMAGTHQFRKIIDQVHPQVIHANSAMAQVYAGPVARRVGIPCVWHCRDLRPIPFPADTLCRQADRIVAVSKCVADFLASHGFPRLRISCLYNAIDAAAWRRRVTGKDVRAELGLAPEARLLLMAAQWTPWKRHEDALRALPHILARCPEAHLLLAGADLWGDQPALAASLQALAQELQIAKAVHFLGQRSDVADLMNAADLVLIPSDAEPFGRVAIEAMALAKPVVGTRAGGLAEVVRDGETGLLVAPRFPESLAEACVRLLENPALAQRLGENGRKRVEGHFAMDPMLRALHVLYEALLTPSLKGMPA